jgi:hypothetical protein
MRRIRAALLAALTASLIAVCARAQTPALLWAKQLSGGGIPTAYRLALHGTKLWVSGNYTTSIDLGGATYGSTTNSFLACYSTDGTYQWSHAFNVGGGVILAMGSDATDNLYITGQFDGTVDFGNGPLVSLGGYDIFLAKFNSAGVLQWAKRFGDAGVNDAGVSLVVDLANNVIIGGRFSGTTDFGGGGLVTAGGTDAFMAKFTGAGAFVWAKRYGDATSQEVDGLASVNNDIYATGTFSGAINLGGSTLTSAGKSDIFLARLNSAGDQAWSARFGDSDYQYGVDVDVDATAVTLLANIDGTVNFGGSPLVADGQDIAVARFSNAGVHVWSQRYGGTNTQTGVAVRAIAGSVFVSGFFQGTLAFGPSGSFYAGSSNTDAFLARLSTTDGSEIWGQHFGYNINGDYGEDVVSDATAVYTGGRFERDLDLGYNGVLVSPDGTSEAFLAKFGVLSAEPLLRAVGDVSNDQGGRVRVDFTGAAYDVLTTPLPIRNYELYLREDPLSTAAPAAAKSFGETWILAGQTPAHALGSYYALAFTQEDSTLATGMHTSVYKVRATTDDPSLYFDSVLMGGFSLDNLAPAIPLNFVINNNELSWSATGDKDVAYYSVYGSARGFDKTAELIDTTAGTRMDVGMWPFAHYFVTATDVAGNEGRPAALDGSRSGSASVPRTLSVSAFPNPFNPQTTIRYTLPAAGRARVDVFDAAGAPVRTLVDREQTAGAFTTEWNGRNAAGRPAASGIYFARIEHNGVMRAYKLVMLK